MCGKNQVFARQKRQFVHNEGNNALSSRRRNAISCDPSVGDKVESGAQLVFFCPICGLKNNERREVHYAWVNILFHLQRPLQEKTWNTAKKLMKVI